MIKKIDKGYITGVMDALFILGKCGKTPDEYVFGPISISIHDDAIEIDYGKDKDRIPYDKIEGITRRNDELFIEYSNKIKFAKLS